MQPGRRSIHRRERAAVKREQLSAIVRLLIGIGILALMLMFMRACFSPPMMSAQKPVQPANGNETLQYGTRPPGY